MSADPRDALVGLGERLRTLGRTMTPGALGGRTELASAPLAVPGIVPPTLTGEAESGALQPHAQNTANITNLATATWTVATLSSAAFLTINGGENYFSVASNALEVVEAGTYRLSVKGEYDLSTAGTIRALEIQHRQGVSWSHYAGNARPPAVGGVVAAVSIAIDKTNFAAGEAFRVRAYQDSGVILTFTGRIFIEYLGPVAV